MTSLLEVTASKLFTLNRDIGRPCYDLPGGLPVVKGFNILKIIKIYSFEKTNKNY